MNIEHLTSAVEDRKVLAFEYDDQPRLVEPHAIGLNKKQQLVMRGYQVTGGSATASEGWKLFTLDKVDHFHTLDLTSHAPRAGYKAGDKGMVQILAELPEAEVVV